MWGEGQCKRRGGLKKRSNTEGKMDSDADVCQKRRGAVSKLSRAGRCDLFMR